MDDEIRDGLWRRTVEVTAEGQADLIKKVAAVERLLKKLAAEKPKPRRARGEGALYFRQRDGMWVGQIELPRGPDGKRQKTKPIYSKDRAVVVAKLGKLKDDAEKGLLSQSDVRLTVGDYLDTWIVEVAPTKVKPHALASYKSAINTRIKPAIGGRRLAELKPDDIRQMHKWILAAKYKHGKVEKTYTTRSVEEAHNVLSSALSDALADGKVHRNVCELVSKPNVLSRSHGDLTSEHARAVLIAAIEHHDPMATRWAAGLMLGGRQGELLGLEWDRVDFDRGMLDLSWQLEWLPLKSGADPEDPDRFDIEPGFEHRPIWRGAAWTRPKTTKSQRVVPLPEPLAAILTLHRDRTPANRWNLVWVSTPKKSSRWQTATPIGDSVDRDGWKAAQERAGVDPVDVHAMRGTTATLLMEAGVDARIIQAILGHSNVVTTRGYQTVNLDAARASLGNLHGLLELS
ncbi:tyrosine-type recombinase/integrase [Nocardia fluminea]|uniref:Integrase-like protein n=1 Tax=Nocardia fluminea TaxID=134984 RepID=A0A2N3VGT6_9NOCA|nr:site-specific integrase [Nocardia fluminea]PKV80848.1 integrase-like protein [Nocardia fluminea]